MKYYKRSQFPTMFDWVGFNGRGRQEWEMLTSVASGDEQSIRPFISAWMALIEFDCMKI